MDKAISVIGLGHVGLPTAVLLANSGFLVNGIDKNIGLINDLKNNKTRINEKDFLKIFQSKKVKKQITFSKTIVPANVYIIAVPTPIKKNKTANLSMINDALNQISKFLRKDDLILIESTSPIGICEHAINFIYKKRKNLFKFKTPLFDIAYCPERVLPGNLVNELRGNDRIIGGFTEIAAKRASKIYSKFCRGNIIIASSKEAEATKLIENSYRDLNIAFANEISLLLEEKGIEPRNVFKLANMHPRVNVLMNGIGVGGHCIPVDPYFLIDKTKHTNLLNAARVINDKMPKYVSRKIIESVKQSQHDEVTILGLTYKPDIHDFRESPALDVVKNLKSRISKIRVCDPYLSRSLAKEILPLGIINVSVNSLKTPPPNIVILVGHKEFKQFKANKHYLIDFS